MNRILIDTDYVYLHVIIRKFARMSVRSSSVLKSLSVNYPCAFVKKFVFRVAYQSHKSRVFPFSRFHAVITALDEFRNGDETF